MYVERIRAIQNLGMGASAMARLYFVEGGEDFFILLKLAVAEIFPGKKDKAL